MSLETLNPEDYLQKGKTMPEENINEQIPKINPQDVLEIVMSVLKPVNDSLEDIGAQIQHASQINLAKSFIHPNPQNGKMDFDVEAYDKAQAYFWPVENPEDTSKTPEQ